jgi:hypothetical protein
MVPERSCAPTIFRKSIQAPTASFELAISGLCYGQGRQVSRRLIETSSCLKCGTCWRATRLTNPETKPLNVAR